MSMIEDLAMAIIRLSPRVPLSQDLWSTREVAYYLKRSENVVRDHVVHLPGFPKSYRIPSRNNRGRSHPLWRAAEVIEWVEKYRERY